MDDIIEEVMHEEKPPGGMPIWVDAALAEAGERRFRRFWQIRRGRCADD